MTIQISIYTGIILYIILAKNLTKNLILNIPAIKKETNIKTDKNTTFFTLTEVIHVNFNVFFKVTPKLLTKRLKILYCQK